MKHILLLFVAVTLLTSCRITERVYIQENGAVKYETELDFSEMMGLMFSQADKDSLRQIGEYPIDSIMKFSDLEKLESKLGDDQTSEAEREFMKALDKMNVRMVMNDNEGKMIFGIQEKDIKTFNASMKEISEAGDKLAAKDKKSAENLSQTGLLKSIEFKYDGKSFQRIGGNQTGILEEMEDSTAESTRQMMGMFTYKLEYHFPKKIKKSSVENATYSLDGKTMTIETSMMELFENPDKYNFIVEFE